MEQFLSGLHWKTLLIYLHDVIVISPEILLAISVCENVVLFCYLGLQIYTDQGAQFQSQLMGDLCRIGGGLNQSHHQNIRMLGDALRSLLLRLRSGRMGRRAAANHAGLG